MEVGTYHYRFCDSLARDIAEARRGVGNSGLVHQVDTFSSSADDLHTGGILQVIYSGDCPATWSASLYHNRQGS